jgi:hypothetical protein
MTKDEKQCPFCAETIKKSAIKCRFCQSELIKEEINPSKQIKTSKKLTSKEEVEIDYLAEKIASGTASIVSWLFGIGIIALIFYFITGSNPINFFNNSKTTTYTLEELISSPVVNIDPEKLTPIFEYFSDYTDLQREKIEKDLKGKVIIWNLEVYDVKSTKNPNIFQVQTSSGTAKSQSIGTAGLDRELDRQLAIIMQGLSDSISENISGTKSNHNVGTFIKLYARDKSEISRIESLKTGSWIKIKARIKGTSSITRNLNLDPAIFFDETKQAKVSLSSAKNCQMRGPKYSHVSDDEIKSQDLVNYMDQSGKILVHYGRGNKSSDIEIFNLDSNTFTSKNSNFKENNEYRKLTEEDLSKFYSYQDDSKTLCKFNYDLVVSNLFRCQLRGSNFQCDWQNEIDSKGQIITKEKTNRSSNVESSKEISSWSKANDDNFMEGCYGGFSSNKKGWCECVLYNLKNNFTFSQWHKIQENSANGIRQDDANQIWGDITTNKCSNLNR